ncbi:MAG TPA: hypothetical protein VN876_02070, partial [Gemmatimonadaceae bacterium]|nr:hypothetical protein [Gemmatimonadaceae bacterium]
MADGCVFRVHVVGTDRTDDDLAGIDADSNLERRIAGFAQTRRIFAHLGLHPEGGVQCAMGVILVGYGRAEQGEDSIAGGLNYVAVVVMDRVDHQAQSRIDDRARLFWIQLLHQIHRTLDVGEEGGHRLALLVGDVIQRPFGRYANRAI